MATKSQGRSGQERWLNINGYLKQNLSHLLAWAGRVEDFSEIRLKARDDGTILAIAKGYGSDGAPVVLFGSGYDIVLALIALDGAIQGGKWRVDKPWPNGSK